MNTHKNNTIITLKKNVQRDLAELLNKYNFLSKQERLIEYECNNIKQIVHLAFTENKKENTISMSVNLAIRFNQIEEMVTSCTWANDLTAKEKRNIATIGIQIGNLIGNGFMEWKIHSEEECLSVSENIFELIEKCGFHYLNSHSDLKTVLHQFQSDNFKEWHATLQGRALRMPIIYLLLGDIMSAKNEFINQYKKLCNSNDYFALLYPQFVSEICRLSNIDNPMEKERE